MNEAAALPGRFMAEVVEETDARGRPRFVGYLWRQWLDGLEWTPQQRSETASRDAIGPRADGVRWILHELAEERAPGEWVVDVGPGPLHTPPGGAPR